MAIDYWCEMPESTGDYEQKGGGPVIPEGTRVLASVEEIKTQTFDGSSHESLNLKWRVEEPEEYNNRVFYQTIKINGTDPLSQYYNKDKQDTQIKDAFKMLSAIDKNAGGNIGKLMRKPTDAELTQYIVAAKMWVNLGVYNNKQIIRKVSAFLDIDEPSKQAVNGIASAFSDAKIPASETGKIADDDIDMDIPF
jgi:hypothetical protein